MLDSRPLVSLHIRLANKAADYLGADRLPLARVDEETLKKDAITETGLTDFGDTYYQDGLLTLIDSINKDARLNFIGRIFIHRYLVMYLSNRLLLAEALKRNADVFQRPLIPPIIVTGLPRTGTTFLHRMLAEDPTHRGVPLWELLRPLSNGTSDRRRNRTEKEMKLLKRLYPSIDQKHYLSVDTPEECIALQGTTFASAVFPVMVPVFSYAEWLLSYNQLKAYEEYRMLLQILQAVEADRRLTLKAPAHLVALPALHQVIPDAMIIQTHRDPVVACSSAYSLIYSWHAMTAKEIDVRRSTEIMLRSLEKAADMSLSFHTSNPDVIYDVYYDQLVADPMGTLRGIYDHFRLDWSSAYEDKLKVFMWDNTQKNNEGHSYCSANLGLTDDEVAVRFTKYSETFGFDH